MVLTITLLPFFLLNCHVCTEREKVKINDELNSNNKLTVNIPNDVANPISDNQFIDITSQAKVVSSKVLEILEKGKCYSFLEDDVDKNPKVFEKWVEKTKESQKEIAMVLKMHPKVFCILLVVQSHSLKEMPGFIPKNFNQFMLIWSLSPQKNSCLVLACPDIYALMFIPEKDGILKIITQNVPSYYSAIVKKGKYPNFTDEGIRSEPNQASLIDTIIASYNLVRFEGDGSKGLLVSFNQKVKHKGRDYWADGIRTFFVFGYTPAEGEKTEPECPRDFYGKENCLCATISLPEE